MLQNILDLVVPESVLVDRFQLRTAGLSQKQIDYCVQTFKLQSVVKGVYRRPGPPLKWPCVVHSLVKMGIPCRVASVSALQRMFLQKGVMFSAISSFIISAYVDFSVFS